MPSIGSNWVEVAVAGLIIRVVACMNASSTFT